MAKKTAPKAAPMPVVDTEANGAMVFPVGLSEAVPEPDVLVGESGLKEVAHEPETVSEKSELDSLIDEIAALKDLTAPDNQKTALRLVLVLARLLKLLTDLK